MDFFIGKGKSRKRKKRKHSSRLPFGPRPSGGARPMVIIRPTRLVAQRAFGHDAVQSARRGHARGGTPTEGTTMVGARSDLPLRHTSGEGEAPGNKGGGSAHRGTPALVRRRRGFGAAVFCGEVVRTMADSGLVRPCGTSGERGVRKRLQFGGRSSTGGAHREGERTTVATTLVLASPTSLRRPEWAGGDRGGAGALARL
jgi:hypothetical protein